MKQLLSGALLVVLASTAAHAGPLRFDEKAFTLGQSLDETTQTVVKSNVGLTFAADGDAVVTEGADTYFRRFNKDGVGRSELRKGPGNIVAVSGAFTISFDELVNVKKFRVFGDFDGLTVTADTGKSIEEISVANAAQYDRIRMRPKWRDVTSLTFDFGEGSGGIDNITFRSEAATEAAAAARALVVDDTPVVPVPASLPLLLAGMGVMGFAARRKR